MSNYRDEHGNPVDWNPRFRGGPGSEGEALFRTHFINLLLLLNSQLGAVEIDLSLILDELKAKAEPEQEEQPGEHLFSYNVSGGTAFWPEKDESEREKLLFLGGKLQELYDTATDPLRGTTPEKRLAYLAREIKWDMENLRELLKPEQETADAD